MRFSSTVTILIAFLPLVGCAGDVGRSHRIDTGVDPKYQDQDVRFRTTYYFRVFDVCDVLQEDRRLDDYERVAKTFTKRAKGRYTILNDSLYRFRMTGKASAVFHDIIFESGTLRAEQIDPFGSSIDFDKTTRKFQVRSASENREIQQRNAVYDEVRSLYKLRNEAKKAEHPDAAQKIEALILGQLENLAAKGIVRQPVSMAVLAAAARESLLQTISSLKGDTSLLSKDKEKRKDQEKRLDVVDQKFRVSPQQDELLKGVNNLKASFQGLIASFQDVESVIIAAIEDQQKKESEQNYKKNDEEGTEKKEESSSHNVTEDSAGPVTIAPERSGKPPADGEEAKKNEESIKKEKGLISKGGTESEAEANTAASEEKKDPAIAVHKSSENTKKDKEPVNKKEESQTKSDTLFAVIEAKEEAAAEVLKSEKALEMAEVKERKEKGTDLNLAMRKLEEQSKKLDEKKEELNKVDAAVAKLTQSKAKVESDIDKLKRAVDMLDRSGDDLSITATSGAIMAQSRPICGDGMPSRRGFQVLGPEGFRSFDQDERLVMAMSIDSKPLISTLQQFSDQRFIGQVDAVGDIGAAIEAEHERLGSAQATLEQLRTILESAQQTKPNDQGKPDLEAGANEKPTADEKAKSDEKKNKSINASDILATVLSAFNKTEPEGNQISARKDLTIKSTLEKMKP